MKFHHIFLIFLFLCPLSSCTPRNAWTTYTVDTAEPVFRSYSFEYPANWTIEEGNNQISLVSHAKLLKDVPDKLEPGQIIVGLSMNINMLTEEMVNARADGLNSIIRFDDSVSVELDGRPSVYKQGSHTESKDQIFILAVDLGQNMRGLLTARTAEGELEKWREVMLRMARSLQIAP